MGEQVFIRMKGCHLLEGRELLQPGSVVAFDEATAVELVKRGMGTLDAGPAFAAPAPAHGGGCKADGSPIPSLTTIPVTPRVARAMVLVAAEEEAERLADAAEERATPPVDRADLGERLARAEKATARPQRTATT